MIMNLTMMSPISSMASFFEIVALRSQWEEIVEDFKLSDYNGTIDNLRWFVDNGHASNRFRRDFDLSLSIAKKIIEFVDKDNEAINISSLPGEEV